MLVPILHPQVHLLPGAIKFYRLRVSEMTSILEEASMYFGGCKLVILELHIAQQCDTYGTRLGLDFLELPNCNISYEIGCRREIEILLGDTPGFRTVFNCPPSIAKIVRRYCPYKRLSQEARNSRGGRYSFLPGYQSIHLSTL